MRAAIDIGSNSLRLMVGEIGPDRERIVHDQEVEETRLGAGLREGRLTEEAIGGTFAVLQSWQRRLAAEGIASVRVFATSAIRDAANREDFSKGITERFGWQLKVLSGEEEAYFSFHGAVSAFPYRREEVLLFDVGGGSTEVTGYEEGRLLGVSAQLGAVRWPVMGYSRPEAKEILVQALDGHGFLGARHFVAVGGTITTAAAILSEIADYRREAVQGLEIEKASLTALHARLAGLSLAERKKMIGMPAKRADILPYGLEIFLLLAEIFPFEKLYVSDAGILDGVLFAEA